MGQAAEVGDLAGVAPLVDHAHQEEQRAGGQAVGQHLEDAAGHAQGRQAEQAQHHEAQVADRGVGHQLLDVRLHHGHQGAVDDADHRQDADRRGEGRHALGEQRHGEAQHAVGAHLQQHAGQDHRAGGRRLDVGVGQPGVQRKDRHLDGEGQEEGREEPELGLVRPGARLRKSARSMLPAWKYR